MACQGGRRVLGTVCLHCGRCLLGIAYCEQPDMLETLQDCKLRTGMVPCWLPFTCLHQVYLIRAAGRQSAQAPFSALQRRHARPPCRWYDVGQSPAR